MIKNRIRILVLLTFLSIAVIVLLYLQAEGAKAKSNGFTRNFPQATVKQLNEWPLSGNAWRIAGTTDSTIYLNSIRYLNVLTRFTLHQQDTQVIRVQIDSAQVADFSNASLYIKDSSFYLVDGNVRRIYRGKTGEWYAKYVRTDKIPFLSATPLPSGSFLYYMLTQDSGFFLARKSVGTDTLYNAYQLLEKQQDEYFSKDGQFLYDHYSSRAVYTYSYRNEFVVSDTNLHLLYRGHTIDTITHAKITLSAPDENGIIKMASPPLVVNSKCSVSHGYLFVNTALRADNQSKQQFADSLTIDVYDLADGKYRSSFLIPNEKKVRFMEFKMEGNKLIALFDQTLKAFTIAIPGVDLNR
jgi:hypothetical protein